MGERKFNVELAEQLRGREMVVINELKPSGV